MSGKRLLSELIVTMLMGTITVSLLSGCGNNETVTSQRRQEVVTTASEIEVVECTDLQVEGYAPFGLYVTKDNTKAYVYMVKDGDDSQEEKKIFVFTKEGNQFGSPKELVMPECILVAGQAFITEDGKKLYTTIVDKREKEDNNLCEIVCFDIDDEDRLSNMTYLSGLDDHKTNRTLYGIDEKKNILFTTSTSNMPLNNYYATWDGQTYSCARISDVTGLNLQWAQTLGSTLSSDGTVAITALPCVGETQSTFNLHACYRIDGKWQNGLRLNSKINTMAQNNISPSISGDGKTLYYIASPLEERMYNLNTFKIYAISLEDALLPESEIAENEMTNNDYDDITMPPVERNKQGMEEKQGIYYELFVRAFADSDGDGIGDFNGITENLDYLEELGVEGIWLMPINPTYSYHGYDVADYYTVNPEFGTEADFENMINEAHKRDIKVIMDLVINHTSNLHPWFLSATSSPDSAYRDYYRFVSSEDTENYQQGATSAWGSNVWHDIGDKVNYYGIFSSGMPDLNYNNTAVREEAKKVAQTWLEKGVDGFRLDAIIHIYGDHEFEKQKDQVASNVQWWHEFASACEEINPNVYLVGEAWHDQDVMEAYAAPFDTKFNFTMQDAVIKAINSENIICNDQTTIAQKMESIITANNNVDEQYIDGIFMGNHDTSRIMTSVKTEEKAKLVAGIELTLPGNPFLYYGEELGAVGDKADGDEFLREAFKWNSKGTAPVTNWQKVNFGVEWISRPTVKSVEEQKGDENSILNYYKKLIALRKSEKALTNGDFKAVDAKDDSILAYLRSYEGESVMVIHNLSKDSKSAALEGLGSGEVIFDSSKATSVSGNTASLAPYTTVMIKCQ